MSLEAYLIRELKNYFFFIFDWKRKKNVMKSTPIVCVERWMQKHKHTRTQMQELPRRLKCVSIAKPIILLWFLLFVCRCWCCWCMCDEAHKWQTITNKHTDDICRRNKLVSQDKILALSHTTTTITRNRKRCMHNMHIRIYTRAHASADFPVHTHANGRLLDGRPKKKKKD